MANEFKIRKGLIVEGASGGTVVDVQGSQGQLFSVTDDLSGSIFAVSDISGVPILDINSSGDSNFSGDVLVEDNLYLTDAGTVRAKLLLNSSDRDNVELRAESLGSTMKFFTVGTEALELDASQNATFAGRVMADTHFQSSDVNATLSATGTGNIYLRPNGYSTTTGQVHVDTSGNATFAGTISSGNISVTGGSGGNGQIDVLRTSGANVRIQSQSATGVLGVTTNHPLHLKTNDTTRVTIAAGGNVGIGTTSPSSRLTVKAAGSQTTQRAITIFHDNTLAEGYASIGAQYTATNGYIDSEIRFGSETLNGACSFMSFATGCNNTITQGSNSERMRITSSGNVGIGTDSPVNKLNVNGDIGYIGVIGQGSIYGNTGNSSYANMQLYNPSNGYSTFNNQSYGYYFLTGGGTKMTILNNGNVGIGTTSPNVPLEIHGADITTRANTTAQSVLRLVRDVTDSNYTSTKDSAVDFMLSRQQTVNNNLPYTRLDIRLAGTTDSSTPSLDVMSLLHNGNVGIGTTSPAAPLNVAFADNSSPQRWSYGPSESNYFLELDTSIPHGSVVTYNFNVKNNGTTYNNNLVLDRGNVGIGTDSPGNKLHVDSGSTSDIARFENDNGFFRLGQTSNLTSIDLAASNAYRIRQGSTVPFYIKSDGNVGIGTTSPTNLSANTSSLSVSSARTDLSGGIFLKANNVNKAQIYWDSSGQVNYTISGGIKWHTGGSERMRITDIGNVGIGTATPNAKLDVQGTQGQLFSVTDDLSGDIFSVADISGVPIMNVNSDGTSYFDGNVGIGTTSPSKKLTVYGGNDNGIWVDSSGSQYTSIAWGNNGTEKANIAYDNTNANFVLSAYGASNTVFSNNGSERMRIDSAGNVGIGTNTFASTPNLQLKMGNMGSGIVGEIFDAADDADNSRIIVCGGGSGTPQFSMRHYSAGYGIDMWLNTNSPWDTYIDNRNAASGFIFRNNCNNDGGEDELMRITGSGNVGIGTTSPDSKLDVKGPSATPADGNQTLSITNSTGGTQLNLGTAENSYGWIEAREGSTLRNLLINPNGGNVGIGTTSPSAGRKLDVHGDIELTEDLFIGATGSSRSEHKIKIGQNRSGNGYAYIDMIGDAAATSFYNLRIIRHNSGANALSQIIHTGTGNFEIKASDGGDIILNSSGSIGISQTSPSYKLDVTGDGRFTSTVTAANFILSSDERLKENVEKVCDNKVEVDWKTFELKTEKGQKRYGVIAQELEKTNPEFVREDSQGFKSVAYIDLLIAKIAELEARLEKLEK